MRYTDRFSLPALNLPTDGTGTDRPGAERPLPAEPTWGSRLLTLARQARATVIHVEPCTQSQALYGMTDLIDGELYTSDCRRGNLRAKIVRGGTPQRPVGHTFKLHPFAGGKAHPPYGASQALPVRVHMS